MNCSECRPFIDTYVDGELDQRDEADIEAHLRGCSQCRAEVRNRLQVKESIKNFCGAAKAPSQLRKRICDQLEKQPCGAEDRAGSKRPWREYAFVGTPIAATVVFAFYFFLPHLAIAPATSKQVPLAQQTVEWHTGNFPLEFKGEQTDSVSEWFRDKVNFPVRLPPFDHSDVQLRGGRIANIAQQRSAYIGYRVDGAKLSVIIFAGDEIKLPSDEVHRVRDRSIYLTEANNYNVALLRDGGLTYAMTSSLEVSEFISLIEEALAQGR